MIKVVDLIFNVFIFLFLSVGLLSRLLSFSLELWIIFHFQKIKRMKNYNSKKEDLEEEDQRQDERNVIL